MTDALLLQGNALALPLADQTVDLVVTSPPYFALRSYQDGDEHMVAQVGSEATPRQFLEALWAATREAVRVLKPTGSIWVNLGDKYAGSCGHNNGGLSSRKPDKKRRVGRTADGAVWASRRNAPDRYVQATEFAPAKSLLGLPWRYAIGCVDQLGLILRAEVIWSKPNGMPESVLDRVRRSHEQWFHFTKQGSYFADIDAIREPYADATLLRGEIRTNRRAAAGYTGSTFRSLAESGDVIPVGKNPLGKLPGSVWTISSAPFRPPPHIAVDHFAAFPPEWPRRLILGWSPPGGVVLDPFGGTGTVAMMARVLGRRGVSVDLSADYQRLARWRVFESGHGERALNRASKARCPQRRRPTPPRPPPPQCEGQMVLPVA